ncbi:ABC transporter ATP-binding protein [Uliginosibacterium sp. H3]|uniref:ABC transporter ATP-binding protein n=1 Tax=Uliginosibacterium silvisoli TaxID=3114758 RepID=A0ABU6K3W5_9RHOO|nr:ABC transporter ATP-binding protein [Uliginosibacterium sp. H3]
MTQIGSALRLSHITKRFGSLVANDDISLELGHGEVLALLGENGAGKSTLVSILFGHYVADAGSIEVFGKALPAGDPKAALAAGVGMVHQHFALADNLSVLDNVLLGTEPLWQLFSRRRAARAKLVDTAQRFGLGVNPDAAVGSLSVGERQRVEILKALYRGARILILDEPTAVLTPQESESLFATLAQLVAQGLSIIFISHKLDEVLRVSHRVAVLRAGKLVSTRATHETSKAELAELMVGRTVSLPQRERGPDAAAHGDVVLRLERASVVQGGRHLLGALDLEVHAGEIVGIAGVSGNGQLALAQLLCGTLAASAGKVSIKGESMRANPREWVARGVARIPEDRHAVGVVGDLAVWENAVSERLHLPAFSRFGFIRRKASRAFTRSLVERFDVRLSGIDVAARVLSGGNMQKLILGRALSVSQSDQTQAATPIFIIANQPTWGLDIGAVAYVHRCLLDAAAQGAAVLLISEDLDELFAIADRVAVMFKGRLGKALPTEQWTLSDIGLAMAGGAGEQHAA